VGTLERRYSKKVMDFQLDRRGFDSAPGTIEPSKINPLEPNRSRLMRSPLRLGIAWVTLDPDLQSGGEPYREFECPDGLCLGFIDDEGAIPALVAKGNPTPHPHALFLGGCDLVANAFSRDLALELRKGQQD